MSSQTVVMPQLGESVLEGVVIEWLVEVGSHVSVDEPLCIVETDKANAEVPSPIEGYVSKLSVELEDVVSVGEELVEISDTKPDGASAPAETKKEEPVAVPVSAAPAAPTPAVAAPAAVAAPVLPAGGAPMPGPAAFAMPSFAAPAEPQAAPAPKKKKDDRWRPFGHPADSKAYRYPQPVVEDGDTVEKFSRRRAMIAEHMVISQAVSPHVVTVAEVDMTNLVNLRALHKKRLKAQGINITYLVFLLQATTQALTEFPTLNAVVGDGKIIKKGRVNLGCAVETPAGLVVPVIKDADQLNTVGIAGRLGELAAKARDNNLAPDDISGGTFTVSNPGLKGNLYGGAIINQPQVGIVRMGEIKKRPMVIKKDGEEVIAIRSMMYLALSYDHRVIDGVTGNSFLFRIRELLEQANFRL